MYTRDYAVVFSYRNLALKRSLRKRDGRGSFFFKGVSAVFFESAGDADAGKKNA